MRFPRREAGVVDVTRIVYEGIVAAQGNDAPEYEEVVALIVREGVEAVTPAAVDLLTAGLRGLERFSADHRPRQSRGAALRRKCGGLSV